MTELAIRDESILARLGASVTATSLTLSDPNLSFAEYEELCAFIGSVNRSCAWWTGDVMLAGEKLYGDEFVQAAEAFGLAPQTLANRISICRHVPPARRNPHVNFSAHAEVAALEPREQTRWLKEAEERQLTKAELRASIRAERNGEVDSDIFPPAVTVEEAARAVWHASVRIVGDSYVVAAEPMLVLREALGE